MRNFILQCCATFQALLRTSEGTVYLKMSFHPLIANLLSFSKSDLDESIRPHRATLHASRRPETILFLIVFFSERTSAFPPIRASPQAATRSKESAFSEDLNLPSCVPMTASEGAWRTAAESWDHAGERGGGERGRWKGGLSPPRDVACNATTVRSGLYHVYTNPTPQTQYRKKGWLYFILSTVLAFIISHFKKLESWRYWQVHALISACWGFLG